MYDVLLQLILVHLHSFIFTSLLILSTGTICEDMWGKETIDDMCTLGVCLGKFILPAFVNFVNESSVAYGTNNYLLMNYGSGMELGFFWVNNATNNNVSLNRYLIITEPLYSSIVYRTVVHGIGGATTAYRRVNVQAPSVNDIPINGSQSFLTTSIYFSGFTNISAFILVYKVCIINSLTFSGMQVLIINIYQDTKNHTVVTLRFVVNTPDLNASSVFLSDFLNSNFSSHLGICANISSRRRALDISFNSLNQTVGQTVICNASTCATSAVCYTPMYCLLSNCVNDFLPDHTPCDDFNNDTVLDECFSGQCLGLYLPINCTVSEWSNFTACTTTPPYTHNRSRFVITESRYNGMSCPSLIDVNTCVPINCQLGNMSSFSNCTEAFPFVMTRSHVVITRAQYGGYPCPSQPEESVQCNATDCVVSQTSWVDIGNCSKVCDTGELHQRQSILVPPEFGGTACILLNRTVPCNDFPCPVDCVLSGWSEVTPCNSSCNGWLIQNKNVISAAANGGINCSSDLERVIACNTNCECAYGIWVDVSNCSFPCGVAPGFQTQVRSLNLGTNATCLDLLVQDLQCFPPSCSGMDAYMFSMSVLFQYVTPVSWNQAYDDLVVELTSQFLNIAPTRIQMMHGSFLNLKYRDGMQNNANNIQLDLNLLSFSTPAFAAIAQNLVAADNGTIFASLGGSYTIRVGKIGQYGASRATQTMGYILGFSIGGGLLIIVGVALLITKRFNFSRTRRVLLPVEPLILTKTTAGLLENLEMVVTSDLGCSRTNTMGMVRTGEERAIVKSLLERSKVENQESHV